MHPAPQPMAAKDVEVENGNTHCSALINDKQTWHTGKQQEHEIEMVSALGYVRHHKPVT